MTPATAPSELATCIRAEALRLGFDLVGIADAVTPETLGQFSDWCSAGHAGEMGYLERRRNAYSHPQSLLNGVRSLVMVALNYASDASPQIRPGAARVACYAWGTRDYHDVLRERLQALADALHELAPGCRTRAVVDTAPLLERDFARRAGLGWFGKNTMLLNKRRGSWFFLGALVTDVALPPDAPHATAHCGTCTRCLDACPTDAFVAPYVLDARRCISYLTIELRGRPIPDDLRAGLGEWLFGCDVCQDVCPWNRKPPATSEPAFRPRSDLHPADCAQLLSLTDEQFQDQYGATPLARPGRTGIARNACIVLGNTGDSAAVAPLRGALQDPDPVVRDAAAWGLKRLVERGVLESATTVAHNPG